MKEAKSFQNKTQFYWTYKEDYLKLLALETSSTNNINPHAHKYFFLLIILAIQRMTRISPVFYQGLHSMTGEEMNDFLR